MLASRPQGVVCPRAGAVYMWKKMCIKSEFKEMFLKLSLNGRSDKAFLTSKFCPQGVVCLYLGLYTCEKTHKNDKKKKKKKTSKVFF